MWKKIEQNFEEYVLGVFLIGMAVILFIQILMRTIVGQSLTWAEEVARYMYVWSVFLSIACTIRRGNILRVELVEEHLPAILQKILGYALKLINVVLYGFLFWNSLSVVTAIKTSGQTSPALEIPMFIVYAIIPVGFALATIRSIQAIWFEAKGKEAKAQPSKNA